MIHDNNHNRYSLYKSRIERQLSRLIERKTPVCVYEPIDYVLKAGGKRVRAVLTLLSCEAVGGTQRRALPAACAIEILHNFTLVHDDVMDNSPLRRGRATVHTKWDTNVAILSGDELVAYAYQSLLKTKSSSFLALMTSFTNAFIEVCEGQGFDKEYERRSDVTLDEYLLMIEKKTARVISAACELGAIAGNGTRREIQALRTFGEAIGMAFQIQDDVLDITATEQELGKPIGGDVMEGKKTYLLLRALQRATPSQRTVLERVVHKHNIHKRMVQQVLHIYEETGALDDARYRVIDYTSVAQNALKQLQFGKSVAMLRWLSQRLLERNS